MGIRKRLEEFGRQQRVNVEIGERKAHEKKMANLGYELARARRETETAGRIAEIRHLRKEADKLAPRQQGGILGNLEKIGNYSQRALKNLDAGFGNQGRKSKKRREWWE